MPILAIYALIAAAIFGSGYGACWSHMTKQVSVLEAQIQLSNEDAKRKLLDSITATEQAEQAAAVANVQLETEHDKAMQLNNDLSRSLSTVRMRVPTKHSDCSGSLSKGSGTSVAVNSADTTELPDDLEKLLRSESYRADQLAVYAIECQKFILTNCGIKQ